MSRAIKAMKLLHTLSTTFTNSHDYIQVSELTKILDTDPRNIRNIVTLLNRDLHINIESKPGRDGGYRLKDDIYKYLFNISYNDIDSLYEMKQTIMDSKQTSSVKKGALNAVNKITKFRDFNTETNNPKYKSNLIYDTDYLRYLEQTKINQYSLDIKQSESHAIGEFTQGVYAKPYYLKVEYRTHNQHSIYNIVSVNNIKLDGYESFIVLNLDTLELMHIDLKYVLSIEYIFENPYGIENIYQSIEGGRYKDEEKKLKEQVEDDKYVTVKIIGNISKKSIIRIQQVLGDYITNINDLPEFKINRTRIPLLYALDIPELEGSYTYQDEILDESQIHSNFIEKMKNTDEIVLDVRNYINYWRQ